MTQKSELGKQGEDAACAYLVNKKFQILERNVRRKWGELDIVARAPDKTLVFIEVKTLRRAQGKSSEEQLSPEDQMTREKLKKFKRAASLYAGAHNELIDDRKGWRLDMLALVVSGVEPPVVSGAEPLTKTKNSFVVRHYENIF